MEDDNMRFLGYSRLRTDLPGGRHANIYTMRAMACGVDENAKPRQIAGELADERTSTQFAGWSPDGELAIIGRYWKDPDAADREEREKNFLHIAGNLLYDSWLVNFETGEKTNVTAVDRISFYNAGLKYWPNDPDKLTFQAIINGRGHPIIMNKDGTGKRDLLETGKGFTYGAVPSPDGKTLAYQTDYKIRIEYGGEMITINTGFDFNFGPLWSPDGKWLSFVAGNTHKTPDSVYLVSNDGKTLRKLCDRGGYRGYMLFLDVPDYHEGSSDVPVWASDGSCIYLTRADSGTLDIWKTDLSGNLTRLTNTAAGVNNYHPSPSPDGKLICFGSDMSGTRQLHIMRSDGYDSRQLTHVPRHNAAMWAYWRPTDNHS